MKSKSLASLLPKPRPDHLPDVFTVLSCRSGDQTSLLAPQILSSSPEFTKFPHLRYRLLPSIPSEKPRANVLRWQMQHAIESQTTLPHHSLSSPDKSLVLPKLKPHTLRLRAVVRTKRQQGGTSARALFPF